VGLRGGKERHRAMIEGRKDYANFTLDPGGRVATWNDGAERVEGYEGEEILGRHFSVFYADEDVARGRPEDLRAAATEGYHKAKRPRVRGDGSTFRASSIITALRDREGDLQGFSVLVHDETESRRAVDVPRSYRRPSITSASTPPPPPACG
jgi:PAS domain S-box-containing protein